MVIVAHSSDHFSLSSFDFSSGRRRYQRPIPSARAAVRATLRIRPTALRSRSGCLSRTAAGTCVPHRRFWRHRAGSPRSASGRPPRRRPGPPRWCATRSRAATWRSAARAVDPGIGIVGQRRLRQRHLRQRHRRARRRPPAWPCATRTWRRPGDARSQQVELPPVPRADDVLGDGIVGWSMRVLCSFSSTGSIATLVDAALADRTRRDATHWLYQATSSPSTMNTPTSVPSQEMTRRSPSASSSDRSHPPGLHSSKLRSGFVFIPGAPQFGRPPAALQRGLSGPPQSSRGDTTRKIRSAGPSPSNP